MSNENDNPLLNIFRKEKNGTISSEIENIENIKLLWSYLEDENKPQESKSQILNELTEKIKINRYICEYFSTIEDIEKISIYILIQIIFKQRFIK